MFYENIYDFPSRSIFFAIPYLILALVSFWVLKGTTNYNVKKKGNYIFLLLLYLFFFGLRWHIFSDSLAYEEEYNTIKPIFNWNYIDDHSWWWDKGFVIFTMFTKLVSNDFRFFVFVNTLIDITLFAVCIKRYSCNFLVTILAFLAFQGILTEINLFRNIKSILLFLFSIKYIENRKWYYFFPINLLGYTLHSSALLFFPMYWLLNIRFQLKYVIVVVSVITFIYLLQLNVIENLIFQYIPAEGVVSNKLNVYMDIDEESVLSIGTFERLITLLLSIWVYYKTNNPSKIFTILFNSFLVFYVTYSLFGFNPVFRDRIPYLFIYSYWFLYPFLFNYVVARRRYLRFIFYLLFFVKIYTSTCLSSAFYENVLFDVSTRSQRYYLLYNDNR